MQRKKMAIVFFLSLITCFGALEAKHEYGDLCMTTVLRVHDGDTFIGNIEGVHPIIGEGISVRINGIDCPEITDKRPVIKALAIQARDYVIQRLQKTNKIELRQLQRDKYFRLLANVYVDGTNLADELVFLGLAKHYDGGKKPVWGELVEEITCGLK